MATPTPARTPLVRVRHWLNQETTGGILLLIAAAISLIWANSPWQTSFTALANTVVGPAALHLNLSLAHWASDGLLAIFFFVVGVELKHELVAGSLRHPKEAAVPVVAAVGGMALPAGIYCAVVMAMGDSSALEGWAIPTATDIAFALAVLAILGRGLPRALRIFLLTLAVVDDLLAIIVIAVFYTDHVDLVPLLCSLAAIVVFGILVRTRRPSAWLLVPIAVVAWAFMHASGIHATIAGVLLGFTVPAVAMHGEAQPRTHTFDHAVRPISAGIALPIFAFFAAGVTISGGVSVFTQPVFLAVVAGLVLGKVGGVLGATAVVTRFTPLRLPNSIGLRDLLPIGFLCGIGFTVSLLITELSFEGGEHLTAAKLGILVATALAAVLGGALLRWDARQARAADMNQDGVADTDTGQITGDSDADVP